MSLAVWPPELPRPERGTWQAQIADPRLRRAGDGPPGYRRRFSTRARLVGLSIDVPRAGKAVFDRFFEEDTRDGSLPFLMPDPTTDGWPMLSGGGAPVLDGSGVPLLLAAQWLCLFGDDLPLETLRGTRFGIAFSVAVLP